jgi:hypothetical protein
MEAKEFREEDEEEIEEVEAFSPIVTGPGETIEEQIIEADETTPRAIRNISTFEGPPLAESSYLDANGTPRPKKDQRFLQPAAEIRS